MLMKLSDRSDQRGTDIRVCQQDIDIVRLMPLRKNSSQVEVLWEDHRNDLFINGFGILMSAGGSKLKWCKWFLLHSGFFVLGL